MGRLINDFIDAKVGGRLDVFNGPARLMSSGRRGVGFSWDLRREYEQRYKVFVRSKTVGPNGVCYAPGLPLPFAVYNYASGLEYDPDALATRFSAAMQDDTEDGWEVWIVTVTYSTEMPEGGVPDFPDADAETGLYPDGIYPPGMAGGPASAGIPRLIGAQTRPDMVAPEIYWDEETVHRAPPHDLRGVPFWNAAQIPITPAPMFDFPYDVLVVVRNEVNFDHNKRMEFSMAYNTNWFLGAPQGCAQCLVGRAKKEQYGWTPYHRVMYRIRFTPNIKVTNEDFDDEAYEEDPTDPNNQPTRRITWPEIESTFLEQGMHELWVSNLNDGPPTPKWRAIRDADGFPVTTPRLLYGTDAVEKYGNDFADKVGTAIPLHLLQNPALLEHKPYYVEFRVREYKDFTALFYRGLQMPLTLLTPPAGSAAEGPKYWIEPPP
jgi:hypothetical protein